jgi:hypothetical protein
MLGTPMSNQVKDQYYILFESSLYLDAFVVVTFATNHPEE